MNSAADSKRDAVSFTFKVNRFGYRFDEEKRDLPSEDDLKAALTKWEETVAALFGDSAKALELSERAGILPRHPSWDSIAKLRAPDRKSDADPVRDAAEFRNYLENLYAWLRVFRSGARAAAIAGIGFDKANKQVQPRGRGETSSSSPSVGTAKTPGQGRRARDLARRREETSRRRLDGLEVLAAVLPAAIDRDRAREQIERLADTATRLVPKGLIEAYYDRPDNDGTDSPSWFARTFADKLARQNEWLDGLKNSVEQLSAKAQEVADDPSFWPAIENGFWQLWERRRPGEMDRNPDFRGSGFVDLLHAARHGKIPVVPPKGGRLSIPEWSRIFAIAQAGADAPSDLSGFAADSLGIGTLLGGRSPPVDRVRIVVLRPKSAESPVWRWAPEKDVPAIALMPGDVHDPAKIDASAIAERLGALRRHIIIAIGPKIVEFVESDADDTDQKIASQESIRGADRAFFGFRGNAPETAKPYCSNPPDLRRLLAWYDGKGWEG